MRYLLSQTHIVKPFGREAGTFWLDPSMRMDTVTPPAPVFSKGVSP